jgi:glutamate decarboxylase
MLDEVETRRGWDIPLHVDAAAGAFILPFTEPELVWDFRLPRVKTISVSSHQHGGVYPGLGWLLFREAQDLPRELLLDAPVNGRLEPTLTLSASHGGTLALAQYYNLLRHGRSGYRELAMRVVGSASYLAERLAAIEHFELIGAGRRLPVVAVSTARPAPTISLNRLAVQLGQRGWAVETGRLPGAADQAELMRFIVSEHFSRDMADLLARDILDDIAAQRS